MIWCGDINADFVRGTYHTNMVQEAVEELSLYTPWDEHTVDFTCVSETNGETKVSKLDHFFLSRNLRDLVKDAYIIQKTSPTTVQFCCYEKHGNSARW